ncbi:MAG: hypothetical protein ACLQDV_28120 [Candidatus Binataceae bacterium]
MSDQSFNFEAIWSASQAPAIGRRKEAQRLATAMRRVIDHLVQVAAPESDLSAAADALERYADRLAKYPVSRSYEGFAETANAGDTHAFFDHSPLIGMANPLAPPIRLAVIGDHVEGRATFGVAYEGPPGHVHGGFLAAAFDEVLGMAQSLTGNAGMTPRWQFAIGGPRRCSRKSFSMRGWIASMAARFSRTEPFHATGC